MAKRKTTKRSSKSKAYQPRILPAIQDFVGGISPDRWMDIFGVAVALVGALTLLAVLSGAPGGLGAAWLGFLRGAVGWGVYIVPLALLALGLWLVLRHFERIPAMQLSRILGGLLLFVAVLVLLHWATLPAETEAADAFMAAGKGGGNLGNNLLRVLLNGLGTSGAFVSLVAWLLVALALTLDVSVLTLFGWLAPVGNRVGGAVDTLRGRLAREDYDEYEPLTTHEPVAYRDEAVAERPLAADPDMGAPMEEISEESGEHPAWTLPALEDMLDPGSKLAYDSSLDQERAALIEETLDSFGAPGSVVEINRGPTITQFGVEPDFIETRNGRTRVRVNKIASLADDLALAMAASRVRIEAPVPGKGYVGIEVPNEQISMVAMRDILESDAFKRLRSALRFALGEDVAGHAVAADLGAMPHLLIAGATGSGKSVMVNSLICGLLINNTPETLRFIMIDPKRVELTGYNGIPHLMTPVVVDIDRVVGILQWVTHEMDKRYEKFAKVGARHIADFNQRQRDDSADILPYLVVVIDELADLMMVAPDQTERLIARMAQLARATGIHLVISTQRPSVDVVTGIIKANFPARIAFAVASGTDSRVILDAPGAERLLGRGDMLFQAPDAAAPVRLQGVYLAESEIIRIVNYWRAFAGSAPQARMSSERDQSDGESDGVPLKQMPIWKEIEEIQEQEEQDEIFDEAVALVRRRKRASISMLQRRLRIGYTRAARIIEDMEARGIISPPKGGAHHRDVLDYGESLGPTDLD